MDVKSRMGKGYVWCLERLVATIFTVQAALLILGCIYCIHNGYLTAAAARDSLRYRLGLNTSYGEACVFISSVLTALTLLNLIVDPRLFLYSASFSVITFSTIAALIIFICGNKLISLAPLILAAISAATFWKYKAQTVVAISLLEASIIVHTRFWEMFLLNFIVSILVYFHLSVAGTSIRVVASLFPKSSPWSSLTVIVGYYLAVWTGEFMLVLRSSVAAGMATEFLMGNKSEDMGEEEEEERSGRRHGILWGSLKRTFTSHYSSICFFSSVIFFVRTVSYILSIFGRWYYPRRLHQLINRSCNCFCFAEMHMASRRDEQSETISNVTLSSASRSAWDRMKDHGELQAYQQHYAYYVILQAKMAIALLSALMVLLIDWGLWDQPFGATANRIFEWSLLALIVPWMVIESIDTVMVVYLVVLSKDQAAARDRFPGLYKKICALYPMIGQGPGSPRSNVAIV